MLPIAAKLTQNREYSSPTVYQNLWVTVVTLTIVEFSVFWIFHKLVSLPLLSINVERTVNLDQWLPNFFVR